MEYSQTFAGAAQANLGRVRADGNVYCSVRRYFAYLIDSIWLSVGMVVLMFAAGWMRLSTTYVTNSLGQREPVPQASYTGGIGGYLILIALSFGYFVILEWAAGWTIGKMFLGLRVVSLMGDQISVTQAVVRNLLLIVDGLFGGLVALVSMLSSDCRQRLGDRAAGTMVVRW